MSSRSHFDPPPRPGPRAPRPGPRAPRPGPRAPRPGPPAPALWTARPRALDRRPRPGPPGPAPWTARPRALDRPPPRPGPPAPAPWTARPRALDRPRPRLNRPPPRTAGPRTPNRRASHRLPRRSHEPRRPRPPPFGQGIRASDHRHVRSGCRDHRRRVVPGAGHGHGGDGFQRRVPARHGHADLSRDAAARAGPDRQGGRGRLCWSRVRPGRIRHSARRRADLRRRPRLSRGHRRRHADPVRAWPHRRCRGG